ncbi:tetratricopeptide repeat protein [bacterium]|nr:tetratricopeptide repeat protein [bacterium]
MSFYILSIIFACIALFIGILVGRYLIPSSSQPEPLDALEMEKGAYIKGLKYIISNEPDKAIAEFTRAVQINSDTVEIYINLGNLFREKGEIERAIRIHQSILLRPKLSQSVKESALMDLGLDYSAAGLFDRAISTFQQLISLNPDNPQAHRELEKLYEEEAEWENAFDEAKKYKRMSGSDASSLLAHIITELGKELYNKNENNQAIKELKRAISINKNSTEAYLILGDIFFSEGKLGHAIAAWEKIIHLNLPFSYFAYEKLEKAYLKKGDYDHIEQIYREVLAKRPDDFTTRIILAEYYQKKGLSNKAVKELRDAIRFKPKSLTIRKKLGEILLKEDLKDAIRNEYQALIEEMKGQRIYSCSKCGYQGIDFIWKCPQCKEWDTFVEEDT